MKRKKRSGRWRNHGVGIIVLLIILFTIGVFGVYYKYNASRAYVMSVEEMNNSWILYNGSYEGNISDAATQNVYITDGEKVSQVYVEKGDAVTKGQALFQYDTTTLQSQYDEAVLSVEAAENALSNEKSRLEKYNAIVPVAESEKEQTEEPEGFTPSEEQQLGSAYSGSGIEENPYLYLCTENTLVSGSQINTWVYDDTWVVLEIREGDTTAGELVMSWEIQGANFIEVDENSYWSVSSRSEYIPEVDETEEEDTAVTYTQAEKEKKVKEQTIAVQKASDAVDAAKASEDAAKVKLDNATVTATMDGTVQTLGDAANPPIDGSPFLTLTSESGLAVTGYLTEFQLDDISVGDTITVNGWESGSYGMATITTVSHYPKEDASDQFTNGNPNVSWYPYTAVLEDATGFTTGESVEITLDVTDADTSDAIVLEQIYVRTDAEGSYVLMDDGNGKLKRQEVTVKATSDSEYIQVTDGLTVEDKIAFPYGSKGKVGLRTTTEVPLMDRLGL